jgi:hypothetical protein
MSDETLGIEYGGVFIPLGDLKPETLRNWAKIREKMESDDKVAQRNAEAQLEALFRELGVEFKVPKPTELIAARTIR